MPAPDTGITAVIFDTEAAAEAFRAPADVFYEMPPPDHWADIRKHPTENKWACMYDDRMAQWLGDHTPVVLGWDWYPEDYVDPNLGG